MKNVTKPRTVSFEDALRNLATKLTGTPVNELPRTQEGVVQYMAENVPSMGEMAEAITKEVIARLAQAAPADGEPDEQEEPAADGGNSTDEPAATEQGAPKNPEQAQAAPAEEGQAKTGGKSRKSK